MSRSGDDESHVANQIIFAFELKAKLTNENWKKDQGQMEQFLINDDLHV